MQTDQYSLTNLRDIVIPEAPPFWPPSPGMWVAIAVTTLFTLLVLWQLHNLRQRNAYRRAGLLLLSNARSARDVSVALKRVALAVFPRERVASLYGDEWSVFLQSTCPDNSFGPLAEADGTSEATKELTELASLWIRQHQIVEPTTSSTTS